MICGSMVRSSENIGHVFFVPKFSHPFLPVFGFQVLSGVPLHFSSTDLKDIGVASSLHHVAVVVVPSEQPSLGQEWLALSCCSLEMM